MFGYVMANPQELRPEQRERYLGCYCGICRAIGEQNSLASRLALNYDMSSWPSCCRLSMNRQRSRAPAAA